MEKEAETKGRVTVEEAISQAKIRHCPKCKKAFLKESGCNKMTCGCGTKSCEFGPSFMKVGLALLQLTLSFPFRYRLCLSPDHKGLLTFLSKAALSAPEMQEMPSVDKCRRGKFHRNQRTAYQNSHPDSMQCAPGRQESNEGSRHKSRLAGLQYKCRCKQYLEVTTAITSKIVLNVSRRQWNQTKT